MFKEIALDFETDGLDAVRGKGKIHCFALVNDNVNEAHVWNEQSKSLLIDYVKEGYRFICHSAQFDISVLNSFLGLKVDHTQFACTMVLEHLINPQLHSYSLDAITGQKLDYGQLMKETGVWDGKDKSDLFKLPYNPIMARYNLQDARATWYLWKSRQVHLESDINLAQGFWEISNPFVEVIMSMHNGMYLDTMKMVELSKTLKVRIREKTEEFLSEWPIIPKISWDKDKQTWYINGKTGVPSLSSPADITSILYLNDWTPTEFKRDTGRPIIDKAMLTRLYTSEGTNPQLKEVARKLSEIKSLQGIDNQCHSISKLSTYGSGEGEVLYAGWLQTGTKTHRLSSYKPNLQNLSTNHPEFGPLVRSCFRPQEGYSMLIGDLSQVELAVLAYYLEKIMNDSDMAQAVRDAKDVHSANTENWTGLKPDDPAFKAARKKSKNGIFATNYGASANRLSLTLNIDIEEARSIILKTEESIPIKELKEVFWSMVRSERDIEPIPHKGKRMKKGVFYDALKCRHFSPDTVSSDKSTRKGGERQSFNCLLQGSVASIFMKLCYGVLIGIRPLGGWIASTVHDECILLVPTPHSEEALEICNRVFNSLVLPTSQGSVPIRADFAIVSDWSEK